MYNALAFVAHSCISTEDNAYEYIAVLAYVPQDAGRCLVALRLVWGEGDRAVFTASVVSAYVSQKSGQVNQSGNEDEQADAKSDRARLRAVLKFDAKNPLVALATIRGFLHQCKNFDIIQTVL